MLRRLERDALVWCVGAALVSLAVEKGRPDVAFGVLAGGALIGLSYWAIKGGVDALASRLGGEIAGVSGRRMPRRSLAWTLVKFTGRYALLGFLAYVMIARLRLHPVGVIAGASSIVVAAAAEAVRSVTRSRPPIHR